MFLENFVQKKEPLIYSFFKKSIKKNALSHAYIFEGKNVTEIHQISIHLAKYIFCFNICNNEFCNFCVNCRRIDKNKHPDIIILKPYLETIKVEQIQKINAELTKSSFEGHRRILIISEAEKMNSSVACRLLKNLENPSSNFLLILETDSLRKILPTIRSRCQILHCQVLSKELFINMLKKKQINMENAELLFSLTQNYEKALEIFNSTWFSNAKKKVFKWFQFLENKELEAFIFVEKEVCCLVEKKSHESQVMKILIFYFQKKREKYLKERMSVYNINIRIELVLKALDKIKANVSFQSVSEQLVLKLCYL